MKEVKILENVNEKALAYLNSMFKEQENTIGDIIIYEGDVGEDIFIVKSGTLDVIKNGVKIGELTDGDTFGEMAIIDNQTRSATVRATTDVVLSKLTYKDFYQLKEYDIEGYATIIMNLAKELSQRVRDIDEKLQKIWRWYINN